MGNLGHMAQEYLSVVGITPIGTIDRGTDLNTVPAAVKSGACVAVCVVTSPYTPIERYLHTRGFADVRPFYDLTESFKEIHPLSNGWYSDEWSDFDYANIRNVMRLLDTDLSRAHYLRFLAWRKLRAEWDFTLAPTPSCARFFIPEIVDVLTDKEVFLDAGAHTGSVIQEFVKHRKNFKQIWAVEPDKKNRFILKLNMWNLFQNDDRIEVLDCVLSDVQVKGTFYAGLGYASKLSTFGNSDIWTKTIDSLNIRPSFIKLHLEGNELPALKGGFHTINRDRPIIAVTTYHNAEGLWQISMWLMDTLTKYKFLFRNHSWCGTGSVFYAIPEERNVRGTYES